MRRFSNQCPIARKNAAKPILWGQPVKLTPILFPKYGCFHGTLWYTSFHGNTWVFSPISHSLRIYSKTHPLGRAWEISSQNSYFLWIVLFHQTPIFITWEVHRFCNQFLIPWENTAKPILWERTEILIHHGLIYHYCIVSFIKA